MEPLRIPMPSELFAPAESSSFEGSYGLPVLKSGSDQYSFAHPLSWQVTVTNTGGALLVTGTAEGDAQVPCARCLAPFALFLIGEIEGYFLTSRDEGTPAEREDDEFDYLPEDKTIDLAPLIQAALMLELPLIPLCGEGCKGLCPECGADLNVQDCGCAAGDPGGPVAPNPFSALKDLPFG